MLSIAGHLSLFLVTNQCTHTLKEKRSKLVLEINIFSTSICRFESLKAPVADRRRKLEDSLKLHQFNFDADGEMQWIKEHTPAATSTDYGKDLIDAQNKNKNHKVKNYILSN